MGVANVNVEDSEATRHQSAVRDTVLHSQVRATGTSVLIAFLVRQFVVHEISKDQCLVGNGMLFPGFLLALAPYQATQELRFGRRPCKIFRTGISNIGQ